MFDYRIHSNEWCSIEFWFDFVRLDTPGDPGRRVCFLKTVDGAKVNEKRQVSINFGVYLGVRTCEVFLCFVTITVEPVLSGTALSGHPLLSGQLSKSRKLCPFIIVIFTSIKRSRSPFTKCQRAVSIVLTCFKRSLWERKPLKAIEFLMTCNTECKILALYVFLTRFYTMFSFAILFYHCSLFCASNIN